MLINYIQQALGLFEKADAVLICDKDGYIEYAKWYKNWYFKSGEVIGMHILEVYPTLTEESSTILRCTRTGESRIDDEQHIVNFKKEIIHVMSTTLPIIVDGEVIGAICASSFCGKERTRKIERDSKEGNRLYELDDIITKNETMKRMKTQISNAARNNTTVLIYGETGTGKELVAESIHTCSTRKEEPFIAQNCAAIPTTLLESIFFGTERGSYTGAENKKGLFELANHGTLFLDEINSMDFSIQAKILKALEEKKIRRVGGTKDIHIDAKIICAMNENPMEALKKGKIREDLFYRIGVVQIRLIPLRERQEDIMLLTNCFIQHFNKELSRDIKGLSELAKNAFETNFWRGNVRELRNTIESAFNNENGDRITIKSLPELFFANNEEEVAIKERVTEKENFSLPEAMNEYEAGLIRDVLNSSKNMAEAAKKLRISRQNLKYKMEKYDLKCI
ncbi:MAG: sigma 54-interacting transcriptional regulator [Lachnospiraceae bacterium]